MARDGELIQTQYFCHHVDTICQAIFTFSTVDVRSLEALVMLRKLQDCDTDEFIIFRGKNVASA